MFKRLRDARKKKGLSQAEMAALLHVTRQAYARYENDRRPNWETTLEITKILGVSADYLFGLTDNPAPAECLSTEEQHLVDTYRTLDDSGRGLVNVVLQEAARYPSEPRNDQ